MNPSMVNISPEIQRRLAARGYNVDAVERPTAKVTRLRLSKGGSQIHLESVLEHETDEYNAYLGSASNSLDDNDESLDSLSSLGFSHESALAGLIDQLT